MRAGCKTVITESSGVTGRGSKATIWQVSNWWEVFIRRVENGRESKKISGPNEHGQTVKSARVAFNLKSLTPSVAAASARSAGWRWLWQARWCRPESGSGLG